MEVVIRQTSDEASDLAADLVRRLLLRKPDAVLGLATGSTPVALYARLASMDLDWRRVRTFNLDEYIGLPSGHPESYHSFMHEHLFRHINIEPANIHIPDGNAPDVEVFCRDYESRIAAAGGIDLQLLGIGTDGHIGFNEPTSSLASRTRIKTLTPRTIDDNARFFGSAEDVPRHVITMGVGTILEARRVFLLAFGAGKAAAVASAVEGPVSAKTPASALQMHPAVKVFLDEPAASALARADYYRWVFEHKPSWQE